MWQQRWDLIIIDEAHKCSAYTKRSAGRGDEVERTKRYQLAERLSEHCDNLLLLTATPHHGDDDRFAHFIRLLDRDLFPEPHRFGEAAGRIRREILQLGEDCPWLLRRLKEDLKDIHGRRLFPDRHVQTVSFNLGPEEYAIYKAVTAYINEYLPQATGRRKNSVARARTVFQRRLASSTHAIHESLRRRQKKRDDLLRELEGLSPSQRLRRLAQLQERLPDTEQDEDDLDEATRDELIDEATAVTEVDQLRAEVAELGDRVFDVVGEVLSLNKVNLPDMLREVAYEPRRLDDYLDVIDEIDPEKLELYEDATGIALARAHVDFSSFAQANLEAEERRLMPRYVESHFLAAAKAVDLRIEARADGLWRIEHVLADLRSDRLAAVRRLGKPDTGYRKLTFYKEHLEQDQQHSSMINAAIASRSLSRLLQVGSTTSARRVPLARTRGAISSIPATIGWHTGGTTSCLPAKSATGKNPITSRSRILDSELGITSTTSTGSRRCF